MKSYPVGQLYVLATYPLYFYLLESEDDERGGRRATVSQRGIDRVREEKSERERGERESDGETKVHKMLMISSAIKK